MIRRLFFSLFFFFNDTATTEIYTLSLHDALPICHGHGLRKLNRTSSHRLAMLKNMMNSLIEHEAIKTTDRKSTRLNSSHQIISYAVFCLKKKNTIKQHKSSNTSHNIVYLTDCYVN